MAVLYLALLLGTPACQTDGGPVTVGPDIFDEQTSGRELVRAAVAEAGATDRHVILLFGANWCPYCRKLHTLMESDPVVAPLVRDSFVVVPVDVGTSTRNRNTALIDRYDSNVFTDGTPSLVILDRDGNRVAPTDDNPWSARNPIEAERVRSFLARVLE